MASFSDTNNLLSSEFVPSFDETLGVKVDPRSRKIAEVCSFKGSNDVHALAIKDGKFYVTMRENGANKIFVFEG